MLLFIHCSQCKPLISVSVCWLGVVSEEGYWDQSGLEGGEGNRWQKCCHRFLSGLQAFSPPQWFSASLLLGLQLWFCCATRSGHKRGSPRRWIQCWGFSSIIPRHPQGTSSGLQLSTCPHKVHHAVAVLAGTHVTSPALLIWAFWRSVCMLGMLTFVRISKSSTMSCHLIFRNLRRQLMWNWLSCQECLYATHCPGFTSIQHHPYRRSTMTR